ncbi:hypothetical protein Q4604_24675, partial [Marinovum sp. 1_MG-2023]|nr:hypothetical protein [Marinovum sp. 1_MG-2023]
GFDPKNYVALHRWSVSDRGGVWSALWDYGGVPGDKGARAFVPDDTAWKTAALFCPDAQLNLAETMMKGADGDTVEI